MNGGITNHGTNGSPSPDHPKVLAVEDEQSLLDVLHQGLEKEGFAVIGAESGEEALDLIPRYRPDLILLDLMLPGIGGIEVCRRLKADRETAEIPVLMLTARDSEVDIVKGLEFGADDYLTKPFSLKVLAARLRAVLRRRGANATLEVGDSISRRGVTLDRSRRETLVEGQKVDLTYTEFEILWLLASRPGIVHTRSHIVDAVRGSDVSITERAVDVRIVGLRRKLGEAAGSIETVRSVGYRFAD
jgi:two-component system phosphate regulon response regulator PhoB